jgi:sugar lactone lactonase YvrE
VDGWAGLRLNSPNDVVIRRGGTIWFTDPSYGYRQGFRPEPQVGNYVYRVYASASSGVQVFSPAGDLIGQVKLPGAVNFTFGGPGGRVLYITTDTAVWAAVLATAGAGQD